MTDVYVGMGSNLGNTTSNIARALDRLEETVDLLVRSSLIETDPFETDAKKPFVNRVIEVDPGPLDPGGLLENLLEVEKTLGRNRDRNAPDRIIDLDLLYYNQTIRRSDQLRLPHPEAHRRPFVLKSMVELNPTFLHPVLEKTQVELLVEALRAVDGA